MQKKISLWVLLLFFLAAQLAAQKTYDYSVTCQQAYQEIIKLKINNGLALLEKAKQQNPDNLIPIFLENYADFFVLFFNEDPAEYQIRKPKIQERIDALQAGNTNSPFYNYCLSQVYFQKAAIAIKFGENWNAGWAFRKSFQLIKENTKAYPNFTPNLLMYGSLQTVLGTIPPGYTFLASVLGIKGSIGEGMKTVRTFVNGTDFWAKLMNNEALFLSGYLQFYLENKKDEALVYIKKQKPDLVNNLLLAYMVANLSLNNKQPETTKNIIQNTNKSADYLVTPIWYYEMGVAKLYHADFAEAAAQLEKFVQNFKGNFYVKDAYLKLAWCYYMQGNMAAAEAAKQLILQKGTTFSDADKQAQNDAQLPNWPNKLLLKARLLNDGGYLNEALLVLNGKSVNHFVKEEEKLEFMYRIGRINDDLKKNDAAIKAYETTIAMGINRKEYFAARAALQLGNIYEREGKKQQAIALYEKCLGMNDHEYKNSLDQKAKSGLARCKGE